MDAPELRIAHIYTPKIAAASGLIALGYKLREKMPVTVTQRQGRPNEVLFWFEDVSIDQTGVILTTRQVLELLVNGWDRFRLPHTHPIAYLKAADENRQVLLSGVKQAETTPFKVMQNGNRVMVIPPGMSQQQATRLYTEG